MNVPGKVISAAIEEILEKMYFCQADTAGPGFLGQPAIVSQVGISGDLSGRFIVGASAALAARLAADFVAADVFEITDSQAAEIISEFTNVACAAAMAEWVPGMRVVFSVPRIVSGAEACGEWPWRFRIDGPNADLAVNIALDQT